MKIEVTRKGLEHSLNIWGGLETTLDAMKTSLEATDRTLEAKIRQGKCIKNLEREESVLAMHCCYGFLMTEGATYSCNEAALLVLLPCSCLTPALPCSCPAHALLMLCSCSAPFNFNKKATVATVVKLLSRK